MNRKDEEKRIELVEFSYRVRKDRNLLNVRMNNKSY